MRRYSALLLMIIVFFSGCSTHTSEIDRAMALREQLLKSNGCTFDAVITADYGDKTHTFSMRCETDATGTLSFKVTDPESISGICGSISEKGGQLSFEDTVLAFELLADGQLSPVSAPWIFLRTLRSGYLNACGKDGEGLQIVIDDSYADEALCLSVWTDENDLPIRAEIFWQERRILSVDVRAFAYM